MNNNTIGFQNTLTVDRATLIPCNGAKMDGIYQPNTLPLTKYSLTADRIDNKGTRIIGKYTVSHMCDMSELVKNEECHPL